MRLALKKETLAELTPGDLAAVNGGHHPTHGCPTYEEAQMTVVLLLSPWPTAKCHTEA